MSGWQRALIVVWFVVGCGDDPESGTRPTMFGGDRPVWLETPSNFDEAKRYPLILVLHGYGANGFVQQAYFGTGGIRERGEAFVLAPDGLTDDGGSQFWNADDVCCDFNNKQPDDVAYLGGLVEEVSAAWPIDPQAVIVLGHSNGGYMAYRLACERADLFAAIVALAGSAVSVPCTPSQPISVLHIHGDADESVPYSRAEPSVDEWAGHNGCSGTRVAGPALDLDNAVPGAETQTAATAGCPTDGAVELWRIAGGSHIPNPSAAFEPSYWQWFAAHRR